MPLDGMCKNVFLYVWVKSGEDAPRLMGGKMRMQFFTGQPWWRGEAGLGCLVPWTGVPNVSITDAAPTLKYPAVSQLFRCQPNYRWYVDQPPHLHEHERWSFASQHPNIRQQFTCRQNKTRHSVKRPQYRISRQEAIMQSLSSINQSVNILLSSTTCRIFQETYAIFSILKYKINRAKKCSWNQSSVFNINHSKRATKYSGYWKES